MVDLRERIKKYDGYIREMRRRFHAHPELSWQEHWTTEQVTAELTTMGISCQQTDRGVGVIGVLTGGRPGGAVALRADMDALPVQETRVSDCRSRYDGFMHACGHDGHMAMLLGAARMLADCRDEIAGTVYLIFQPSEENGEGARYMMTQGDWLRQTGAIFGGHLWMDAPTGRVSAEAGPRMAAGDLFVIRIHGRGGHGAQPEHTIDAVVVAAAVVMNLQTIVSRQFSPLAPVVLTIGSLQAGDAGNVIAGEAVLRGAARYFDLQLGEQLRKKVEQVVTDTAKAYGATVDIDYQQRRPSVVDNDRQATAIARQAVATVMGAEVLAKVPPTMIGEDFSFYQEQLPGSFLFFGIRSEKKQIVQPHHNGGFTVDEDVLAAGAGVYAQCALDWLSQSPETLPQ